jgi:hypothetical protein
MESLLSLTASRAAGVSEVSNSDEHIFQKYCQYSLLTYQFACTPVRFSLTWISQRGPCVCETCHRDMLRGQHLLPQRLLPLFRQSACDSLRAMIAGKSSKVCNGGHNMEIAVADKGKGSLIPRAISQRNRSLICQTVNPTLVAKGLLNVTSRSKEASYVSGRKKRRSHL